MSLRSSRLAFAFGLAILASTLSCAPDVVGPRNGASEWARGLSFQPMFPTLAHQTSGDMGDLVPFNRVRIVLHHDDGSVALDTLIDFPPGTDEISVRLDVRVAAGTPASGEPLGLNMAYMNAAGDTVFRAGPVQVNVVPTVPGQPPPPPVQLAVQYTGPGWAAAGVRIEPKALSVLAGDPFSFSATAVDAAGHALAGTPIFFATLDGTATISQTGSGVAGATRGTARVVAQLLTGPVDTATLTITPRPTAIALVSGGGQTAGVGAALAQPVVVRVTANDGGPVPGVQVTFAAANGGAVAAAPVTTDTDGRASTSWTLGSVAGVQTMTATVSGLTGSPVNVTATATPKPATRLVVTSSPTTTASLADFSVVVSALDADGAVATGFTGNVGLALSAGPEGGTLGGTAGVAAVAGVARFNGLKLNKAGAGYRIVATSGALTNATSETITVTPGAPSRLSFSGQPGSTLSGQLMPAVSVAVLDAADNIATPFTGSVAISIGTNPSGGSLSGTLSVNAVAGVATFTTLVMSGPGAGYTLVAGASGVTPATSAAFTVTSGVPASLVLVTGNNQIAVRNTLLSPVILLVSDASGNPVADATITATVTLGGGSLAAASIQTDAQGAAVFAWTLGPVVGAQSLSIACAGIATPVIVNATAAAGGGTVATTALTPRVDTLTSIGDTRSPAVQSRDAAGTLVAGTYAWASRTPAIATVSAGGVITGITNGSTWIVVSELGGTRDSTFITVQQRVATINVTPGNRSIYLTRTFPFTAAAVDGRGNAMPGVTTFTWSTTAAAVATVNAAGTVSALTIGTSQVRASFGAVVGVASVNVITPITRIVVAVDSGGSAVADNATLPSLGVTRSYRAIAHDTLDAVMPGITFTWASTNGSVALIDSSGPVTSRARSAANGVSAVTATAVGHGFSGSATLNVAQVLASIDLSPVAATIAIGGTQPMLARGLDANARFISTAIAFTYAANAPAVATVNASGVVTGVALGNANVTASSGAITSNIAAITVSNTGVPSIISFGSDTLSVGRSGSTSIPIFLSKPNATPLTVNISVRDTVAFWSTASVTIPANQTSGNATLNGRNAGTTVVYASDGSGAGYSGDSAVLAVQATLRLTTSNYTATAADPISTQVLMSDPSPAGGTYVTLGFSTPGIATVSPNPAFIPAGQLAADIQILGVAPGNTNITPSAIGVNGTASSMNVLAPVLTFSTSSARLGTGQYESGAYLYSQINLSNSLTVTLTSSDTNRVTVTPTVTIPAGSYYSYFTFTARTAGSVSIAATAPGWASANSIAVSSTSPAIGVCCGGARNTTSPAENITVYAEDSARTGHNRTSSLVVRLSSSDTTVMRVLDTLVTIAPSQYYTSAARVTPGGAGGSAYIKATASGHFSDSTQFTVAGPKLEFSWNSNRVGVGQEDDNVYVYAPNNVVTPLVVNLAADTTILGVPASVTIPAGSYYAYFNVRGKSPTPGLPIVASAAGYQGDTASYQVTSARLLLQGSFSAGNFAQPRAFTVYATDSLGSAHTRTAALPLVLSSTDTTVVVVDTVATIAAGIYYTSAPTFRTVGVGTAKIVVTAAGHRPDTAVVTVTPPPLTISFVSYQIGARQHRAPTDFYVYTPENRTTPLAVTISQLHPAITTVGPTSLTVPANSYYAYFTFGGLTAGVDTIIATAPGYLPDTAFITVTSQRFTNGGLPGAVTTTNPPLGITIYSADVAGTAHYASDTVVVQAVSSDSNVIRPAQPYFRILKDAYFSNQTVNVMGPGAASITYSDSAASGYAPTTTNTVTVTGPSLTMSSGSASLGMRQNSGPTSYYVYAPNNVAAPLTVNLVSSGTRVATVPASVVIPANSYYTYFTISAQDTLGTIQIQATATGYTGANMNVAISRPKFGVSVSTQLNTTSLPATMQICAYDGLNQSHFVNENVSVSLASSAPAVAQIDSTVVTILAGNNCTFAAHWAPGITGSAQLTASDARAVFYQYTPAPVNVSVVTPTLTFSWGSQPLGIGQYTDGQYVYTPDYQTSPLSVAMSHIGPARASTLATLTIPTNLYYTYFRITGTSTGTDTLVASAATPLHNPATAYTVVGPGRIDPVSAWPTTLRVGDSVAVTINARDPAGNVRNVAAATTWTLAPNANIEFRSGGAASAVIGSVTMPADGTAVTFYIKGLTAGAGSATITSANYVSYTNTVTVTP